MTGRHGATAVLVLVAVIGAAGAGAQFPCFEASGIPCGETREGTIPVRGQQLLGFDARAGEVVSIKVAEVRDTSPAPASFIPAWALYPPNIAGGPVCTAPLALAHNLGDKTDACRDHLCCAAGQCESPPLPVGGTFTIQVFDLGQDGSGTFHIDLEPVSATFNGAVCSATEPIPFGQTLLRRIDFVGESDAFTFTAPGGAVVAVSMHGADDPNRGLPIWRLFAPDGTLVQLERSDFTCIGLPTCCTRRCISTPLPGPGGTFTIEVSDFRNGTESYDLTLTGCGNGTIEPGEECDEGASNGTGSSCCNADCTFRAAGQTCRPQASVCDSAESCTGTSGACPADGVAPAGTACADGDLCTVEDSCHAGECIGTRVCSVEVKFVRRSLAITRSNIVEVKRAPLIVRCDSLETGQARRGSCSSRAVLSGSGNPTFRRSLPDGDVADSCDTGMALTNSKTVRFNESGMAIIKLKLNPLARRAFKKLIQKGPVFATTCTTVTRPNGDHIRVAKEVQFVSPCPGGRPSSVCGFVPETR